MRVYAKIDPSDQPQIETYRKLMLEILELLRESGYEREAEAVHHVAGYLDTDTTLFAQYAAGSVIWGSLGCEGAASIDIPSKAPIGSVEAYQQQLKLNHLLVQLATQLKADGMVNPKVESIAAHYGSKPPR